jgi:translation initiation factor RLI1
MLSGGQQQRIAIARLFLKNPAIIFLDEPTASLDAIATEQIKNSLDAIKKDRTVIIVSHSISQIIDARQAVDVPVLYFFEGLDGQPDQSGRVSRDILISTDVLDLVQGYAGARDRAGLRTDKARSGCSERIRA